MFNLKLTLAGAIPGLAGLFIKLSGGCLAYFLTLYVIGGINASDIRRIRLLIKR
jgi:hypothetical protein